MILQDLVARAARDRPHAAAVVEQGQTMTYQELDSLAVRFASALRARGVRPGDRVLLWSGKSALAVAFMQGVLRAGAIYVPASSANPAARVAQIARDAQAALVAVDEPVAEEATDGTLVTFPDLLAGPAAADGMPATASLDDVAYILYTSGSTGTPKGVCLTHRNALAFVEWAARLIEVTPADRLANHAAFNFDLSVFDLYAAFLTGASVHLVPPELAYAPAHLAGFIRDSGISVWYSVPSVLTLMIRDGGLLESPVPPAMRACIFAGEPFPMSQVRLLRRAWPSVRLFNWYGPTETNVCTSYEVTDADLERDRPLPIGIPASGDEISLGHDGEIIVAGPTVMRGYWGRPPQNGPYRTGDIGRFDENGRLEYLGRADHMVKVRGNRVELGEIEAVVSLHPGVATVVMVVTGTGFDARLHAVVVPVDGHKPGLLDLKLFCAQRLPTYMVPDALHLVSTLPLTPNGKADRRALAVAAEQRRL